MSQYLLFSKSCEKISLLQRDGIVEYYLNFLNESHAQQLFLYLKYHVKWQQRRLKLFGKEPLQPRLIYFAGEISAGNIPVPPENAGFQSFSGNPGQGIACRE